MLRAVISSLHCTSHQIFVSQASFTLNRLKHENKINYRQNVFIVFNVRCDFRGAAAVFPFKPVTVKIKLIQIILIEVNNCIIGADVFTLTWSIGNLPISSSFLFHYFLYDWSIGEKNLKMSMWKQKRHFNAQTSKETVCLTLCFYCGKFCKVCKTRPFEEVHIFFRCVY